MLKLLRSLEIRNGEPTILLKGKRRTLQRVLVVGLAAIAVAVCVITGAPSDN